MNQSQSSHCNDNYYHTLNDNKNYNDFSYLAPEGNYHYSHTVIQPINQQLGYPQHDQEEAHWGVSQYNQESQGYDQWALSQERVQKHPYRQYSNNTPPPEESLCTLLYELNDKNIHFDSIMNSNIPLSPMSMGSENFDTVSLAPNSFNESPVSHSTVFYNNDEDNFYQDFSQQHYHHKQQPQHNYHQQQMQLQIQYELERMQVDPPAYLSESLIGMENHPRQFINGTTMYNHHRVNQNNIRTLQTEENQPKRKRNGNKRTPPSQLICNICSRKFSRPYNLKSHQRTHTNERPFICLFPGCSWTFARPHDLKRHDLLHSGIKKYICSCGKPFARSDAFKRHQTVDKICSIRKREEEQI